MSTEAQDRPKLKAAMEASWDHTAKERDTYQRLVKKVAGKSTKHRVVNKLRQSCATLMMELSSGRPRCRIQCEHPDQRRSFAKRQEVNLNRLACEIHMEDVLSQAILSGFYKKGIVYLYNAESAPLLFGIDNWVVPGKPGMCSVSFQNYCEDATAMHKGGFQFQYHFFDLSYDELTNGLYDKSVVKKMKFDEKSDYKFEGSEEQSSRDAFGFRPSRERLVRPRIRCIHVYRPDQGKAYVYPYKMDTPPLWEGKITDPDGPYRTWETDEVPDNTMSAGPAQVLEPLDDLINSTWRKIAMMTNQMRDVYLVEAGHEDDAKKIMTAEHGKVLTVNDKDAHNVLSIGGVNKNAAGTASMLAAQYNEEDNNQRLRAGLGPTAPTATQDAQLGQANSGLAARQKQKVLKFYAECFEGLRRRLWDDDMNYREAYYEHPKLPGIRVPAHWYPGHRVGEFSDYDCEVLPYTITYRSPDQEAAAMIQTLNELAPITPPDRVPDIDTIVGDLAELRGLPRLRSWYQTVEPDPEAVKREAQAPRNKQSVQIRRSEAAAGAINPMQAAVAAME